MVLEVKKNKLNNSSKWFTFGQKLDHNLSVMVFSILKTSFFNKIQLKIYLTDEEKEIFEKKMKLANCKTMSHFLRKCVLEKEIYIVDLEPFRDLQWLLSNVTNNINQIAKATNMTGVIYKNDIQAIRQDVDKLSKEIWDIHSLLLKRIQKIQEYQE